MDSNEIACSFYNQGRSNHWLSQKQTSWLYNQACCEANRHLTSHGTPTAGGMFTLESGEVVGWNISVSPINGCAVFQTHSVTALMEQQNAERAALNEGGKEFVQMVKDTPFADLYPPQRIARIYKVSVEIVQEWINGKN